MSVKTIPQHFDAQPASAYTTARTLAAWLDVSEVTVWRWAKNGKLPKPRKLGENTTRWNVGEVRSWAAATKTAA